MRNGNNVSPPPLDVFFCPSATWPSVSRYLARIDLVRLRLDVIQSGQVELKSPVLPRWFQFCCWIETEDWQAMRNA